jgi:hypothetical protein
MAVVVRIIPLNTINARKAQTQKARKETRLPLTYKPFAGLK